jgi:hypothetical protein
VAEVSYYELIARSAMDAGRPQMMKQYHERAFKNLIDPPDAIGRTNSII